ncbi:MAG: hypothetical protein JNL42_19255 [Anaerolineae bacterium]|nr:hypothetical protein [Anaerolineae bacterium]
MAEKEPNPRNVRRLQLLEADLKALRDSSQALITERDALQQRLSEAEAALATARTEQESLQEEVNRALEIFEELVAGGYLTRPRRRALSAFVRAVADRLVALTNELKAAQERIAELEAAHKALEEQLAVGEAALREALNRIADLQQQIDTRIAESEKRIQALEKALAEAEEQLRISQADDDQRIGQLIEQNRSLSAQIDTMTGDLRVVQTAAEEANARVDTARTEAEARTRAELTPQIETLQGERGALQAQLDLATKQLQSEGKTPLLPADRVVGMLNDLVTQFQGRLTGLRIRDGELKLQVGFGAVGESGGFVIPTTDSTPELRQNMQEITFRFDRSAGETLK